MPRDVNLDVRVISSDVRYADGSEQELIGILEGAVDRSSQSDELASAIHDWPTRYHLSPLRSHLFSPLRVGSGDRILEIGCGTGVNVRAMAERGASVVGIEGTYERALAARIRNAEFDTVEILAGDIADFVTDEKFDVVLVIGVLEYTPSGMASISAPQEFLRRCASFLKPDGVLVLAIENQFGLKYLLSYPEDHWGIPWIGLEGYRKGAPRTWSRPVLGRMLESAGFEHQQWLQPYPDYKLPTVVIREQLLNTCDGRALVKKLIRRPVVDYSGSPWIVSDPQLAFAEMIDGGFGSLVPNSFLVVASAHRGAVDRRLDDGDAWLTSGMRRANLRSIRRVVTRDGQLQIEPIAGPSSMMSKASEWLVNKGHEPTPVHPGTPLDDVIVRDILDGDWEALARHVGLYREYLSQRSVGAVGSSSRHSNPFAPLGREQAVRGELIDCVPQNLLLDVEGQLTLVDHEWVVEGECSLDLLFLRGLLVTALRITEAGSAPALLKRRHVTVASVVAELSALAGVYFDDSLADRLFRAEFALQQIVELNQIVDYSTYVASFYNHVAPTTSRVPLLRMIRAVADRDRVVGELAGVVADRDRVVGELAGVVAERQLVDEDRTRVAGERDRLSEENRLLHADRDLLRDSSDHLRREVEAVRTSNAFRVGRFVTWPLRAPRSLLRSVRKP